MNIQFCSDLHLEFSEYPKFPGGDILILAGDCFNASVMDAKKNDADSRSQKKRYLKFFKNELVKYQQVLHVSGNHEHYCGVLEKTSNLLKSFFGEHAQNVIHLNNESITFDGIAFIGSTLWANYGANSYSEWIIRQDMNDFKWIKTNKVGPDLSFPVSLPRSIVNQDLSSLHKKCVEYIKEEVKNSKSSIVITHHKPIVVNTSYDAIYDAYCSDLSNLILDNQNILYWIHGHLHKRSKIEVGNTKVCSNARGYQGRENIANSFDPSLYSFSI